ncbi:MAG TPA: ATP-dependent DNA helicase RecG [Candidatus Dormibacteraeota bacterium]|jgi:ATP-dependent DNA helicase RecG|nr:ATP-dependent DNA helicase RecG [Candidatus Dormibacteraeota bacterium]
MPATSEPTTPVAVPTPETLVTLLPGVGPRQAARLEKLGIATVRDLLFHLPRRWEDTREVHPLRDLRPGPEPQTVRARVATISMRPAQRRRMFLVEATVEDDTGRASVIWFNQPFLVKEIKRGDELLLSGKVELGNRGLTLKNPTREHVRDGQRHVGRLVPVYPETEGLTSRFLRERIEPLLPVTQAIDDPLPPRVRAAENLLPLGEALRQVHFPDDPELRDRALERIAFEELFLLQIAVQRAKRRRLAGAGVVIPFDAEVAKAFTASLPFRLTDAQRIAAYQILQDMAADGPMNRLLQGDVGSGKTVVATMAAHMAHAAGYQTAFMAPTEILARQHHTTLTRLLEPHGISVRLLSGSTTQRARREVLDGIAAGHDTVLVGTHALIEDDVVLAQLGLVVVDEQHRFGILQRQRLRAKSTVMPNFLAMTATPIPRSLALTMYGDVDLSEIRELPPGRQPVQTTVVAPYGRDDAYAFVRQQVVEGRQAFVICPLIEESDKLEVRSAVQEYERLRDEVFPDLRVELLHGRMPGKEKDERMQRFATGQADVLVSTSVVEVGVDVPNATVMMIEGAERFGLAQLHQFRGRVGRREHASFCLLLQGSADDEGSARLRAVAETRSGFDLAEIDLHLRGPGDVLSAEMRQSGLPNVAVGDLLDQAMIGRVSDAASQWLDMDPDLAGHPPLTVRMGRYASVYDLD